MDFFAAQDHARRQSRLLLLWFALAVMGMIGSVYLALAFALRLSAGGGTDPVAGVGAAGPAPPLWHAELFLLVAAVLGGVILLGSLYKSLMLARGGGAAVAQELGGRLVPRASTDALERRLINVVDEMAIASGIAAPPVYVLDAEQGINAFAAGAGTAEAVVAVTRGALEKLSRDQLQGVIAHEFSHILNGDMRLNLRLIGVLHGILLLTLAGRLVLRSARSTDKQAVPLLLAACVLIGVGYIGLLFGKLIKAAISRQREYLADAAAVQFTRHPAGLAGALQRIADSGSAIRHPRAEEASHMFFGSGAPLSRWLATHPPIRERIRRIDPRQTASAAATGTTPPLDEAPATDEGLFDLAGDTRPAAALAGLSPGGLTASVGETSPAHMAYTQRLLRRLPAAITHAIHQAGGAHAVVFGMLLAAHSPTRLAQLDEIELRFGPQVREDALRHQAWFASADAALRLPVLDLALPALGELADEARRRIVDTCNALARLDPAMPIFANVLRSLVAQSLQPGHGRGKAALSPATLRRDMAHLLAWLAQTGNDDADAARRAWQAAIAVAPLAAEWPADGISPPPSPQALDRLLAHLAATRPVFRKKLVGACATAILHDGRVTPTEAELLRAVCKALDCPVPPHLSYGGDDGLRNGQTNDAQRLSTSPGLAA